VVKSGAPEPIRRFAYLGETEQMFLGQYELTIDEKGRMTIPARFREMLEDGAYIMLGLDQNLMVMTASYYEQKAEKANEQSITNEDARMLKRLLFSTASRVEFDKAGRILIPQFLRSLANLQSSAMVVGVGELFEIWVPERWAEQLRQLQDAENLARRFAALNI